jgi:hypothetical protein
MNRRTFLVGLAAAVAVDPVALARAKTVGEQAAGTGRLTIVLPARPTEFETAAAKELRRGLKPVTGVRVEDMTTGNAPAEGPWVGIGSAAPAGVEGAARPREPEGFVIVADKDGRGIHVLGAGLGLSHGVFRLLADGFNVARPMPDVETRREAPPRDPATSSAPDFTIRWMGRDEWTFFHGANVNVSPAGPTMIAAAHTLHRFVPKEQYYKSHPDYFSSRGPNRKHPQVCTTHPDVIDLVTKGAAKLLAEDPRLHAVTVYPEDGRDFCECPRCKALDEPGWASVEEINRRWAKLPSEQRRGALSRRMTIFYAKVAEGVQRLQPGRKVLGGAYNAYWLPPRDRSIRVPDNLILSLAHGPGCHNHPITDGSCPDNRLFRTALAGWKGIYKNISIYEYYNKLATVFLPWPITHSIRRDIPFYHSEGIRELFSQYDETHIVNGANYVLALRLLWDTKANADDVLARWYRGMYADAAPTMEQYWKNYEAAAMRFGGHTPWSLDEITRLFTTDLIAEQGRLVKSALGATTDATAREILRRTEIGHRYATDMVDYIHAVRAGRGGPANQKAAELRRMVEGSANLGVFARRKSNYVERVLQPQKARQMLTERDEE